MEDCHTREELAAAGKDDKFSKMTNSRALIMAKGKSGNARALGER